jgi:sulfite reductase beta subunit-like hemoprotein
MLKWSKVKQYHISCTAIRFVSIGKTTVGQHVASKLQINGKPVKYIYIDFSNGDRIDKQQQRDSKSFTSELALRIITRLFKDYSYEHASERFAEQLKRLSDAIRVHNIAMTLTQILETWLKHRKSCNYIGLESIGEIF